MKLLYDLRFLILVDKEENMNKHVDFSNKDVVTVQYNQLEQFIAQSESNTDNPKYRFCMHDSPDNRLQEMFIVRKKGDYCMPDRHGSIPETHIIMRGEEAVVLFDEDGQVLNVIFLSENADVLAYRINASIYHMTVTLSEWAIDYEVKPGPFTRETNEFPNWAPSYEEPDKVERFMERIFCEIERRKNDE